MKSSICKILITTLLIISCIHITFAQTSTGTKVSGSLLSAQGSPLDYASVSLLRTKDSTVVVGTLSTEAGNYIFDHIKAGSYIVKAEAVGYTKALTPSFAVTEGAASFKVPALKLTAANRTLSTVSITAAKPLIEHQPDKTVMNVAGSVLAAGNTAMDILERAPGVTIDKDDNISLKGKQGVTVMINDKLTYLSPTQLAVLLRGTDGSTIQSIEIITNPSAKYDAAGNSGIINIKLKKNKQSGTNGTVTVGGEVGTYVKDNASVSINHKQGNLNVFAGFSRGDYPQARQINIDRGVVDPATGDATYFKQRSFMPQTYHYNNYNIGADYDTSPTNTIGFAVNGYFNSNNQSNTNNTNISSTPTGAPDSSQQTLSQINQKYTNVTIDLNDTYKIDTLGQELSFDVDYSKFNNNSNAYYNTYFTPAPGLVEAPIFIRNQTPSTIDIRAAKVDYTKPLTKSLKLEAGAKFSDVKTDNDLEAQTQDNTGVYVNDTTRTNRFLYDEKIGAAYVNLTKTINKNTSLEVGLRAEYTTSRGDLVTQDSVDERKYLNLFPSVFFHHTFNDKNEIGLSYSRRIDRPDYENLNPFVYYLDQYTYSEGNPFLRPQYTNNFEFDYTYNKTINVSLNYSHTTDVIQEIILTNVEQKASYETHLNINSEDGYNISVNAPFTIAKWWTGNVDATGFYLKFKSDTLAGGNLNAGKAAYVLKLTQTFLFAGFKAEVFGNYQSALTYGIYDIKPRYNVDAGVSRSFDNKKLNVKFSVSDIFNTRRNDLDINYGSDDISIRQKGETRIAKLTLTYNFGNSTIKKREHKTAVEDESQRAGGN
jgi:iron complex outermembrane receptor protein